MGAIGGATAKRHRLWSNCKSILMEVDRRAGYLSRADMLNLPGGPLVRHYVDPSGRKRHAGIPGKLRDSQYLVIISMCNGSERFFTGSDESFSLSIYCHGNGISYIEYIYVRFIDLVSSPTFS